MIIKHTCYRARYACVILSFFSAMKKIIIIAEYTHVTFNILIRIYKGVCLCVCVCVYVYVLYVSGPTRVFLQLHR